MITTYKPALKDLWFRQQFMADEATMSYNAAWGGTIPFPENEWKDWYDHWLIHHDHKRFYRYLQEPETQTFVGEIAYHYDEEREIWLADVIVASEYRGKGYGCEGLQLLCDAAKANGVEVLRDDIAIDNPAARLFLKAGFTEEYRTDEIIMLKKELISRRIIVIGSPGSGKSTFARKLRDKMGLPLYYLDMIFHKPDRTTVSREEFDLRLSHILETDEWVIDGNYQRTLPLRFEKCTEVFLFDLPVDQCLRGAASRVGRKREDMPWVEKEFDPEFRQYILDFQKDQMPRISELIEQYKGSRKITVFHSREEADEFLNIKKGLDLRIQHPRIRKSMRLREYDYLQKNVVFVTVCVNHREKLLGEVLQPETELEIPSMQLSKIGQVVESFTETISGIDKYVIMPNHVHMIVFVPEGKHISTIIRSWKTLITKQLGDSIWQREYYDHVIRDEQDYQVRWNYINNNVTKWALDPYYQK